MFRISPTQKDKKHSGAVSSTTSDVSIDLSNPVVRWGIEHNFRFPETLTLDSHTKCLDTSRLKPIHEVPKLGNTLYHLLSQYNPWLDCEMTREKRVHLKPMVNEMYCAMYSVQHNSEINFFRNETVIDIMNLYLWPLLHSRADDVIACKTFSDWKRLFSRTITLAFPDYDYWVSVASSGIAAKTMSASSALAVFIPLSDQRRMLRMLKYITPARVLYLLTTRANIWPYGVPKSQRDLRSSMQYGLCSIKSKIKEYTDKTEIDWLVSADFLRKMKRVHMYFTSLMSGPFGVSSSSNSTYVYDTDDDE
jgi:hypothetical protein